MAGSTFDCRRRRMEIDISRAFKPDDLRITFTGQLGDSMIWLVRLEKTISCYTISRMGIRFSIRYCGRPVGSEMVVVPGSMPRLW